MDRDEVYRRALRAAAAVTGKAGRRLAGVSLGICVAGATTGCVPSSGWGGSEGGDAVDGAVQGAGGAMGSSGGSPTAGGEAMPPMGGTPAPTGGVPAIPETGGQEADSDAGLMSRDAEMSSGAGGDGPGNPVDAAAPVEPVEPDAAMVQDAAVVQDAMVQDAMVPDAAVEDVDMGPIIEGCIPPEGGVSDWQCCAAQEWDRTVPGCTPCNPELDGPPAQWAECVSCAPEGGFPRNEEEERDQFMCCEQVGFDFAYGCIAWGPPAPPAFDGLTLAQRLGAEREHG